MAVKCAIDDFDEPSLIEALYEGAFEDPPWRRFLDILRAAFGCGYAGIIFRPTDRPGLGPIEIFSGPDAAPELHLLYRDKYANTDPVLASRLQEGRVYSLDELFNESDLEHRAYRDAILTPRGIRFLRSVRVVEAGGVEGWLFVARAQGDFTEDQAALLATIARHFRLSLQTHIALENERLRARIADAAIGRLNFGWISLDATGAVIEVNSQARELLASNCGLRVTRGGRLSATRKASDAQLKEGIVRLVSSKGAPSEAISINDDPWLNILLTPIAERASPAGRTPVIIVFLQGDRRSQADRHKQIADLFGLYPCEARLAVAMSQGASIAEAAAAQSISIETARAYSKKLYAKMGARGQVDVVRFVLTSVIALA